MRALPLKYRPKDWDDVTEQTAIISILRHQIDTETHKHCYLFVGPAGCGKTTLARIMASKLNGQVVEVDAASNSGVDNVRGIVEQAEKRPVQGENKIFILDECHSFSNGAWQAFLKLLEEPPQSSIFIFCTTDPQKIPATIISRVQRFDFSRMSLEGILARLNYIFEKECENVEEPFTATEEAMEYIAKLAEGGMREAIKMLDQCLSYTPELTVESVTAALGVSHYDTFQDLMVAMLNEDIATAVQVVEDVYNAGKDLKQFVKQFQAYLLDVSKFLTFGNFKLVQIPDLPKYRDVMQDENLADVLLLLRWAKDVNNSLRWESGGRYLIETAIFAWQEEGVQ